MEKKRPVDIKRDSSGSLDVGTPEDGAIIEMINIDKRLVFIKERSVYELITADEIDPEREYPNLPSKTPQLVVSVGTESEMFARTFLTAKQLIKTGFVDSTIDTDKVLLTTLDVIRELSYLDNEINSYLNAEKSVIDEYEERKRKQLSHAVPSITDVETRCKTIIQKANHALQAQMNIIRLFLPEFGKAYYSDFVKFIEETCGEKDPFTVFIKSAFPFIDLIRNIRNCFEHDKPEIKILNFELQKDSTIISPTIEVKNESSELPRTALSVFLPTVKDNLVIIYEDLVAFLCSKKTKGMKGIPVHVEFVPIEERINKYIKYAYWMNLPNGGYFHQ